MTTPMTVAVLGTGNMGSSIAGRLIDHGHDVVVWNRTPSRTGPLVERGARQAADIADAATGVDAVIISVRDDDAADAVVDALTTARAAASDTAAVPVVNCTTSAPARTSQMADRCPTFVAAPILGAPQAVASGTAAYLVAGPPDLVAAIAPLLAALTSRVVDCGSDPARASIVKLLSNHMLLTGLTALSEAVAVGQAAGLDDQTLHTVLSDNPLVAVGLRNRLDDVISGNHDGWFATPLGAKDLGLFVELGENNGVTPPLATLARDRFREAAATGLDDVDVAAVVELLRRTSNSPQP